MSKYWGVECVPCKVANGRMFRSSPKNAMSLIAVAPHIKAAWHAEAEAGGYGLQVSWYSSDMYSSEIAEFVAKHGGHTPLRVISEHGEYPKE